MSAWGGKQALSSTSCPCTNETAAIMHIKVLREERDGSILDAERIALTDPGWRRWVKRQINSNERCRRMALCHMRHNGEAALIKRDGEELKVR